MNGETVLLENVQLEILVEELSMKNLLSIILPSLLPEGYVLGQNCFIRPHEGKQDLQKQIPIKMRAYQRFGKPCKVLIIQDQDSNDCLILKVKLLELIHPYRNIATMIRIACKELEAWYFGDWEASEKAYPAFKADNTGERLHIAILTE